MLLSYPKWTQKAAENHRVYCPCRSLLHIVQGLFVFRHCCLLFVFRNHTFLAVLFLSASLTFLINNNKKGGRGVNILFGLLVMLVSRFYARVLTTFFSYRRIIIKNRSLLYLFQIPAGAEDGTTPPELLGEWAQGPTAAHSTCTRALLLTWQHAGSQVIRRTLLSQVNSAHPLSCLYMPLLASCQLTSSPLWPVQSVCTKCACVVRSLGLVLQLWGAWKHCYRKQHSR